MEYGDASDGPGGYPGLLRWPPVIERVVLIKLKPDYQSAAQRSQVAAATAQTLPQAAGVRAVRVGTPADPRTSREWDLCIEVVLDDLDAVETYRTDAVHRKYVDVFLQPMLAKIRVYNFDRIGGSERGATLPSA